jgi:beta-glucosidase
MNRFFLTVLMSVTLASCSQSGQQTVSGPWLDTSLPIEDRIDAALSQMTLQEKVRMCYAKTKFMSPGVPRLGIPDVHYSDGPHGVRAEINPDDWGYAGWTTDSITAFPALTCLAATWDIWLANKYGNALAEEAIARDKNVMLGPGVNIYRTPLNGRNFEYLGEDPFLAGKMATNYVQGMQSNAVAACLKHFILNDQEEYRGHINVKVSERAFNEIYAAPFKAVVKDADLWSIMGSYNKYLGTHCSHNDTTLNKILKQEWGFDGMVVTDWGGCHNTNEAIFGGLDVEMGSYTNGLTSESAFGYEDYYLGRAYREKAERGEVPDSIINDKARRILRTLFRTTLAADRGQAAQATKDHFELSREIGAEGIVLLKNAAINGKKLLPIDIHQYHTILVVGENATRSLCKGGGSSELKPQREVSPLEGLTERFGMDKIKYAQGYVSGRPMYGHVDIIPKATEDSLRAEAVAMAREADLVIYVGGLNKNHNQDCEGGDRLQYGLPFAQPELIDELVKANPKTVVVLISGNAVEMPWLDKVPALVQSWYNGSAAGYALADILSGDICPSGKTPFSYPTTLADCPAHQHGVICYPGDSINEEYLDDIFVGYRFHDLPQAKKEALAGRKLSPKTTRFPFGFGLSYTTFYYTKPEIFANSLTEDVRGHLSVKVTVKNIGNVPGKEVVQFYVGDAQASVERPVKELKGFEKIALQPGEEKVVTFILSPDDLKFWDENTHSWRIEPGEFNVYVASSAEDVKGVVSFKI